MRVVIFQAVKHDRNGCLIGLHSQFQITVIVCYSSKLACHVAVIYDFSKLVYFLTAVETLEFFESFIVFARRVFQLVFGCGFFGFRALTITRVIGINGPTRIALYNEFLK